MSNTLRAFKAGALAAKALPTPVAAMIARTAGVTAARIPPAPGRLGGMARRRAIVTKHLERVYGRPLGRIERVRLVDQVFAYYARYWAESLELPSLSVDQVAAGIRYDNLPGILNGLDAGKGVILALPHLGGWEWAGTHLAQYGLKMNVVVEPLQPPDVFEWFVSFRESLGMKVIPVGPQAASQCAAALADNGVLCLLCDRVVGGVAGVEVEFFGERTLLPGGPATLALRTGAALIPAGVFFDGRSHGHLGVVRPALPLKRTGRLRGDVTAGTQLLAAELEGLVRRAPSQWHLMQPNWPSDPGFTPPGRAAPESSASDTHLVK
ncbi:MAG TPA: phosphatidylinositol mannoside acyltransferase [Acidimicrobiales bacterium]